MSSTDHNFSTELNTPIQFANSSLTSSHQPLYPALTPYDIDLLMSQSFPVVNSPTIPHLRQSHTFKSLLEDIQEQFRLLTVRLHLCEQVEASRLLNVQSIPINIDSYPPFSYSLCSNYSSSPLYEPLCRAKAEMRRLHSELTTRFPIKNNSNIPVSYPLRQSRRSSNILPPALIPSSTLPFSPTHSSVHPHVLSCSQSSTVFQPLLKLISPNFPPISPPVIVQPDPILSYTTINNAASGPTALLSGTQSTLFPCAPPITTTSFKPLLISSNDITSISTGPVLQSSMNPPPNLISSSFSMTFNNSFPTFKGLPLKRPIQRIDDFEIHTSPLMGNIDSALLPTFQQVLHDATFTCFGQIQKSPEYITTWLKSKFRCYECFRSSFMFHHSLHYLSTRNKLLQQLQDT